MGEAMDIDFADLLMEVVSRGPVPIFDRTVTFEYQSRGMVQSQFGPLDRLPVGRE